MAIKKNQLSKGGEVGEVIKRRSMFSRLIIDPSNITRKQRIAVVLFSTLLSIVIIASSFLYKQATKPSIQTEAQKYTQAFTGTDNSDASKAQLVEKYGTKYDQIATKIFNSNPASWDKSTLDDACAALLYADKMRAYNQVYALLSLMEAAHNRGMDIDKNSYGINQKTRDEIKVRADAGVKQAADKAKEQK